MTMSELKVWERVCQASATIATEPQAVPAQNLSPARAVLARAETIPSSYPAREADF